MTDKNARRYVQAPIFVAILIALSSGQPAVADSNPLPLAEWMLDQTAIGPQAHQLSQEPLTPRDLYPEGEGAGYEVRRANVVGGIIRRFSVDERIRVNIQLVEHRNHDWASIHLPSAAVEAGLPTGTYLSSAKHTKEGRIVLEGGVAVGRTRISVTTYEAVASTASEPELSAARLLVLKNQIGRVEARPDLPVDDDSPVAKVGREFGYLLALFTVALLLLTVVSGAVAATVRDRGSREVFSSRFRRRARQQSLLRSTNIEATLRRSSRRRLVVSVVRLGSIVTVIAVTLGLPQLGLWEGLALLGLSLVILQIGYAAYLRRGQPDHLPSSRTTNVLGFLGGLGSLATMMLGFVFIVAGISGDLIVHSLRAVLITVPMILFGVVFLSRARGPLRLARRLAQPEVRRLISEDPRKPVLLLRSFQDDSLEVRVHAETQATPVEQMNIESFSRFEEVIAWALWEYGPIRAIGQPGTQLQPLGAVRDYYADDEWQQAVRSYIDDSSMVVFVVGRSPGLLWEVSNVRAQGKLGKCVFILPPVPLEEIAVRMRVLASALGLSFERLTRPPGAYPLVLVLDRDGAPHLIEGPGRDDRAYAVALKTAVTWIDEDVVLHDVHEEWRDDESQDIEELLVRFDPAKVSRPRKSFASRLLDAALIVAP
jgi:MFS family permease